MSRTITLATLTIMLLLTGRAAAQLEGNAYVDQSGETRTLTGTVMTVGERGMVVRDDDRELLGFSEGASTPAQWDESVRPGDRVTISHGPAQNDIKSVEVTLAGAEIQPWQKWNSEEAPAGVSVAQSTGQRTVLPQTASRLPLFGLLGLISCAAAVGVRWLRFHA